MDKEKIIELLNEDYLKSQEEDWLALRWFFQVLDWKRIASLDRRLDSVQKRHQSFASRS